MKLGGHIALGCLAALGLLGVILVVLAAVLFSNFPDPTVTRTRYPSPSGQAAIVESVEMGGGAAGYVMVTYSLVDPTGHETTLANHLHQWDGARVEWRSGVEATICDGELPVRSWTPVAQGVRYTVTSSACEPQAQR